MRLEFEKLDELDDFLVLGAFLREHLIELQKTLYHSHFAVEHCGVREEAGLKALKRGTDIRLRVLGRLYEQAKEYGVKVKFIKSLREVKDGGDQETSETPKASA